MSYSVGQAPCFVTCPGCKHQIETLIEPKATQRSHIIALILCIVGLWCCACAVYCTDCCRDLEHYCPICRHLIGVYKR